MFFYVKEGKRVIMRGEWLCEARSEVECEVECGERRVRFKSACACLLYSMFRMTRDGEGQQGKDRASCRLLVQSLTLDPVTGAGREREGGRGRGDGCEEPPTNYQGAKGGPGREETLMPEKERGAVVKRLASGEGSRELRRKTNNRKQNPRY